MTKTLAEDLKWCVIYLYSDGYSRKQIAKLLYIGETLVNKIISIYAKWGCVISLAYCSITRKKLQKAATERNELLRSAFIASISHYRIDQLVFMNESSKDECTSTCLYSYSDINSRAISWRVVVPNKDLKNS
ncbi:homeodomain-like protein [Rhizophagus clarus]|uniref:Homeodomain-like protein n=1 Tax=Rhizophagus clarus TaxID=94130 RepID=A0A8H3KUR8_9GLOM|nr:homeodomain-like protein [Rhizophagus clarus]